MLTPVSVQTKLRRHDIRTLGFPLVFGLFLGLCLIKFGNPVILDHRIDPPVTLDDWLIQPWPARWANMMLLALGLWGAITARKGMLGGFGSLPRWIWIAPAAWLGWQVISGGYSVDSDLTRQTLPQFAGVLGCFLLGATVLTHRGWPHWLFVGLLAGFCFVLVRGMNQHFFEFRSDYQALVEGEKSGWKDFPLETLRRMEEEGILVPSASGPKVREAILHKLRKGRINGTLVYPNALAGVILLLFPLSLTLAITGTRALRPILRWLVIALVGFLGVGCFYWTGSKAGWLIALVVGSLSIWSRFPGSNRGKVCAVALMVVIGLVVFALRFQGYFQQGATSTGARFDYWRAAIETTLDHPWVGTGPGTFQRPYAARKRPDSEMARLTHNDYLQQASDSGLPGALTFLGWIGLVLHRIWSRLPDGLPGAVALGVTGWFLQGLVEFGLYLPALAWTGFTLAGVLVGLTREFPSTSQQQPD